ncbi:MAG: iron-containing alcohol dehydrogenase [Anaeroplasmataceae bacterium]|nr:iron-containing alcohol dehydrogenase [Anaeroplasmataceae bacterium]
MENFEFYNPTRIIFGKGSMESLALMIKTSGGSKVLLHYGGESIKKNGILESVKKTLLENNIEFIEFGGVVVNPHLQHALKGAEISKSKGVDFVLAIGGGSVIDSAKCLACAVYNSDIWSYFMDSSKTIKKALPIGVVLTIPAAGSESSNGAVITDEISKLKRDACSEVMLPKFAIIDPEFTYSLPNEQIANGACDILAHMMERYFTSVQGVDFTNHILEGAMKSHIDNSKKIMRNKYDYSLRAEMSLAAIYAHNGIFSVGRIGDWASHNIEHELSAINNVSHGAGLAIIFPAWMKYIHSLGKGKEIFVSFAKNVFGVEESLTQEDTILNGIRKLEEFYKELGLPTRLYEINIGEEYFDIISKNALINRTHIGNLVKVNSSDIYKILQLALK